MSTAESTVALTGEATLAGNATEDVDYRIAATLRERASALRLIYGAYLRARLGEPNDYGLRVTPYHLLPTTETFLAVCGGQTIFTMSLVIDGELGLPMECAYGQEIQTRREQGLLLGEVTCLADRRSQFERFFPVFVRVSRLMAQHAWARGLDELLVAVHPRHARFYRRFMHFEPIGPQRAYPTVRNHPAIAMCLNFARVDRERPASFETFFGQWLPEWQLQPQPITPEQAEFFRPMVDPSFRLAPVGDTYDLLGERGEESVLSVA